MTTFNQKSTIRDAGQQDIEELAHTIRHAYQDVAQRFDLTPQNCPKHPSNCTDEWVRKDMERGVRYYVLEKHGNISGCVALEKAGPELGYLERLAVLPPYRRRGFGKTLVRHVFHQSEEMGIGIISIGIIARQEELKTWYLGLGFLEGETKSFDHLPFQVTFLSRNSQNMTSQD